MGWGGKKEKGIRPINAINYRGCDLRDRTKRRKVKKNF
jgi:hypothetical protein